MWKDLRLVPHEDTGVAGGVNELGLLLLLMFLLLLLFLLLLVLVLLLPDPL
jgi:hypothetical protein